LQHICEHVLFFSIHISPDEDQTSLTSPRHSPVSGPFLILGNCNCMRFR